MRIIREVSAIRTRPGIQYFISYHPSNKLAYYRVAFFTAAILTSWLDPVSDIDICQAHFYPNLLKDLDINLGRLISGFPIIRLRHSDNFKIMLITIEKREQLQNSGPAYANCLESFVERGR